MQRLKSSSLFPRLIVIPHLRAKLFLLFVVAMHSLTTRGQENHSSDVCFHSTGAQRQK